MPFRGIVGMPWCVGKMKEAPLRLQCTDSLHAASRVCRSFQHPCYEHGANTSLGLGSRHMSLQTTSFTPQKDKESAHDHVRVVNIPPSRPARHSPSYQMVLGQLRCRTPRHRRTVGSDTRTELGTNCHKCASQRFCCRAKGKRRHTTLGH